MAKKPKMEAKKQPNCGDLDVWFGLTLPWVPDIPWPTKEVNGEMVTDEEAYQKLEDKLQERRRHEWKICGDWIMHKWTTSRDHPGTRPWAWWEFDAPEKRDINMNQADQLARLGLLENWERDQLLEWEMLRGQPDSDED